MQKQRKQMAFRLKYTFEVSGTLPQAQVRCDKLKYAIEFSSTLSYAQVRRGVLEKMTAYLRVAHVFEIDRGFETPIALPLTARHHGGFPQELAWFL